MSRYNLIDEPWIPVRYPDGSRGELGIRETFLRSKEVAAIEDGSPLVVAALHRFLLAVLYRALQGPTDIDQAKAIFKNGLPSDKIEAYLEKWRDRFWLFDEKYPFGQIPDFEPKIWRAWTVLAAEHNADNAKVHFDHMDVENPEKISLAAAVRWIFATQTFSVSAGKSELSHTGTAPSATSVLAIPIGYSLEDTLLFCLVPLNRDIVGNDIPQWERDPETIETLLSSRERIPSGYADRYSWRTRSIRLKMDENDAISTSAFASGVKYGLCDQVDPMVGYRVDDVRGKLPIQFRERGLWRDFDSLLPDDAHLAPLVIEHAAALARSNLKRFPRSVMVLGQANDKAKIEFWRMERFSLPGALSGERYIRSDIKRMLDLAENTQSSLWGSCASYASNLLARGDNRKPAKQDIKNFVEQMSCIPWYWFVLEAKFHEILQAYSIEKDQEKTELDWILSVREALQNAWNQNKMSVATESAWAIRALVKAEEPINRKLGELDRKISAFRAYINKETA